VTKAEVLVELRASRMELELVGEPGAASSPPALGRDLVTPGRFPGTSVERPPWLDIGLNSWMHEREHLEGIRAWLRPARSEHSR
jgi:hypothetical protein